MSVEDSPHPLPAGQPVGLAFAGGRHAVGAAWPLEGSDISLPLGGAGRAGRAVPVPASYRAGRVVVEPIAAYRARYIGARRPLGNRPLLTPQEARG